MTAKLRSIVHSPLRVTLSLLLGAALHATGQVLVVDVSPGPGVDFTSLQPAIDAAADGDVVLVRAGFYGGSTAVTVDAKALSVVADGGSAYFNSPLVIQNLGLGQTVHLRGIGIQADAPIPALELKDCAGSVVLEECSQGRATFGPGYVVLPTVRITNCAAVSLTRNTANGGFTTHPGFRGSDALKASSSSVCAYDSTFAASPGTSAGWPYTYNTAGGTGAIVTGGSLFASGCRFEGGNGGYGWTAQFPFSGCASGHAGGDGILFDGAAGSTLACTLIGGVGGLGGSGCSDGANGVSLALLGGATHSALPGAAHSLHETCPVRVGQTLTATYTGIPGEFAFANLAVNSGFLNLPQYSGVLLLGSPLFVFAQGVIPMPGTLVRTFTIGPIGGAEGAVAHAQASFVDVATLTITLGSPSSLVFLHASL
jgi:hypothetical protein